MIRLSKKGLLILLICAGVVLVGAGVMMLLQQGGQEQGSVRYICPMHPSYVSDRPGECPICGMNLVKAEEETAGDHADHKVPEASRQVAEGTRVDHAEHKHVLREGKSICLLHDCPMLKEGKPCPMLVISEDGKPGECPICKARLTGKEAVPIKEPRDITDYAAVVISGEKQQLIGIRTVAVVKKVATKAIRTVGRIAYDPELYQAEQEYLQAIRASGKSKEGVDPEIRERAEKLVEASKTKLELMGLNDTLIEELEAVGAADRSLLLGKAGGTVWMYASLYEYDLGVVQVGQKVEVTAESVMPGKTYHGEIRAIDSVLDPATRSVRVRAKLDNPEGVLKPNVYVNAEIRIDLGEQLLVPEGAVLDSGTRQIAFVARGNGVFEPRLIKTGPKVEDAYVLLSGVSEGEEVVDQATFFVDSESQLKAALGRSEKSTPSEHQH